MAHSVSLNSRNPSRHRFLMSLAELFRGSAPRKPARPRSRRLRVETLESRAMLTVTATDDWDAVLHDQVLSGTSVLANDYDPEFANLTASLVSGPSNGTLNFNSDGSFTYTPDANFAGSDSFSYEATNGTDTDQASVTVNVINHAPVANDSLETVLHDQTVSSTATAYDLDGDNLTYSLVTGPAYGTLTLSANGSFTYQAPNGFGTDSFTFSVTDGIDTDTGTVTINVTNQAPVANDASESVLHGHSLASTLSAYDADGDAITYSLDSGTAHGFISLTTGGSFAYMPYAGYAGSDSFTFLVSDGLQMDTGTVNITVTNNVPIANDDWGLTYVDEALISSVSAYDVDGDMLAYSVASGPSHGTLNMNTDGAFSYTPATGFSGQDSFTFSASDGMASDTGTFTIQIDIWSGGGGGGGLPVVSISGGGTIEEEGETTTTFTVSRTGSTSAALPVTLQHHGSGPTLNHRADTNDYTLWVDGVASGLTVTIPAGQASVTVTVKAVDDTTVEENEQFQFWVAPSTAYARDPSTVIAAFTINDDEWRWTAPSGPSQQNNNWWWWKDENGNDPQKVVDRTLYPDGTLSAPSGFISYSPNTVQAGMAGQLVFPGIFDSWVYWVERDLKLAFDGDSQTGQIWLDGAGTDLPGGVDEDGGYLSGALEYEYNIDDDTGTDIHVVTVSSINFIVHAGGTYSWSTTGGGSAKGGSGSATLSTTESWEESLTDGKAVTLFFRKGPAP